MGEKSTFRSRDTEVDAVARGWIDSLEHRWRLQILSERKAPSGAGSRKIPTRLRRFVEGIPWSAVKPAIDYLLATAPYTGVIANGIDFGVSYRPTLTLWQRDAKSEVNSVTAKPDATYTLIQDLIEADSDDVYTVGSSSSCSETVESSYVWDAAEVQEIPQGSVGVTWQIAAVNRKEDGTFDYALVKRTAITQHVPETVTESSKVRRTTLELWDNVYPGDSPGEYLDHTGARIDIPQPGVYDGTEVKVEQLSENQDCTLKMQVSRTTAKRQRLRESSSHDIYEGRHGRETGGESSPLPVAPDASGGTIRTHQSQVQPDGSYTNSLEVKQERPVSSSVVEIHKGRRGIRRTVKDRNQTDGRIVQPAGYGGQVTVEKTPGGLFDRTTVSFDRTSLKSGESCKADLFSHSHSLTTSGTGIPSDSSHVSGGSDGYVRTRTTEMDDDGSTVQTVRTDREKHVYKSEESWTVGVDGVVHTVKDTQVVRPGAALGFTKANIGKTVRNERTPGGWYNVTVTDRPSSPALDVGAECQKTVYQHTTRVTRTDPDGTVDRNKHVADAGGGHYRTEQAQLRDSGAVSISSEDVEELEVKGAEVSYRWTPRGVVSTVKDRNTTTSAVPSDAARGTAVSHVVTQGGLYDYQIQTIIPAADPDSARCAKTVFLHTDDDVTIGEELPDDSHVEDAGGGYYREKDSTTDSDGFVKTVIRTSHEIPQENAAWERRITARAVTTSVTDRNQPERPEPPTDVGSSVQYKMNDGGSFDIIRVDTDATEGFDHRDRLETLYESRQEDGSYYKGSVTDRGDPEAIHVGSCHTAQRTAELGDDGIVRNREKNVDEHQVDDAQMQFRSDHFSKTVTKTTRNKVSRQFSNELQPVQKHANELVTHETRYTDGGSSDETETVETAVARQWEVDCTASAFVWHYEWHGRNCEEGTVTGILTTAQKMLDNHVNTTSNYTSASINPNVVLNKYGTFDYDVAITVLYKLSSSGDSNSGSIYGMVQYYVSYKEGAYTTKYSVTDVWGHGSGYDQVQGKTFNRGTSVQLRANGDYYMHLVGDAVGTSTASI